MRKNDNTPQKPFTHFSAWLVIIIWMLMDYSQRLELFEKLKAEYTGLLTGILWKLTSDKELFAEALQFALLGMWQNIEKLSAPKAAGYIYRIALSANSKAWRNRIGKNGQLPDNIVAQIRQEETDAETVHSVRKAISRLPEKQSQALVMRYIDQFDYETIAAKLNCTADTARSHVSKALATLRQRVSEKED